MASAQMERFLVMLSGFSERLEERRVDIKRQLAEEVDRRIDDLQEKVNTLDKHCRRQIRAAQRDVKKEDDAEMVPVVRKKRSKQLPSQGIDSAGPSHVGGGTLKSGSNRKRKPSHGKTSKRARIEDSSDDDDGQEGIESNGGSKKGVYKIKVKHIKCSQSNCAAKLKSMKLYNAHLKEQHDLMPYSCLVKDCGERFDSQNKLGAHRNNQHPNVTKWSCDECSSRFSSQKTLHHHIYRYHQMGSYECGHAGCSFTSTTRADIQTHQLRQHRSRSFVCSHDDCGAKFQSQFHLTRHELIHTNLKPFGCAWPECEFSAKDRGTVVKHVRTRHFKLPRSKKEQAKRGIEDERDPNEYVRENPELARPQQG